MLFTTLAKKAAFPVLTDDTGRYRIISDITISQTVTYSMGGDDYTDDCHQ